MSIRHRTILVTGGAGFIGSNFVSYWITETGGTVINLDKLTYAGNLRNLSNLDGDSRHLFVRGDITDRELIQRVLVEHEPQAIVNFAAESHVDRSIDAPDDFIRTNVVGVYHLLDEARRYWEGLRRPRDSEFRFLHVSTDEVYGSLEAGEPPFTECSPYRPNSPYSATKASADHLVRAYHHTYGLPTLTTNSSNNYGPYQSPEKLIPLMILNALEGRPLPVYGDGANIRDWLYVIDHCRAIRRVLEDGRTGEAYNIGGNCERSNLDVVSAICVLLDEMRPTSPYVPHASLITFVQDRPGHDLRYAIDAHKIVTELNWQPTETFQSALLKTVQWYVDNREWCSWSEAKGCHRKRQGLSQKDVASSRPTWP